MMVSAFLGFLGRELAPTPGRGSATLRLTLACLVATIPILTHRIPHALLVLIVMYLITQEDTAATLVGSVLGVIGVTLGLGVALLAWMVALDISWLRIGFVAAFAFGGLFLKRVLSIGALGSAIGLPATLVMILPDVAPLSPEDLVEFVLWLWLCVTLGLAVNLVVQLSLARGDPLALLQRELDTRLRVVGETVRGLGGVPGPRSLLSAPSLASLATAGMSRALSLLKSASLTHAWARQRHEELAAIITLVDRLVTDAGALRMVVSPPLADVERASLLRVADACEQTRRAFADRRRPRPAEWVPLAASSGHSSAALPPLPDMERTLDEIALALRLPTERTTARGPSLVLPDAFANPEYVQFAVKGALAVLICYVLFVGFDYPGIYTSVITCFVVSLSTIGSNNQKGLLRFGGAAVGGVMGVFALVYAFPNIEGIGGFWLVFGAGTAVAAWINFGSPRISYGGYQTGLAFYKATLQSFGAAVSATVVRDRLIGVAFGLIVFGLVEHMLWPVRAADRMRERLNDVLRSLAGLARMCAGPRGPREADVDARRRLISQQVAELQVFIESSKFEPGAANSLGVERLTAAAQKVFLVLLAIARYEGELPALPSVVREATTRLETEVAVGLEALAETARPAGAGPATSVDDAMAAVEQAFSTYVVADNDEGNMARGRLALCRELVAAVKRLAADDGPLLRATAAVVEDP